MQDSQQVCHSLDARGCPCPQPLIKTRRLWKTLNPGDRFEVIMDNDIACSNLITFLTDQGADPQTSQDGNEFVVSAVRTGEATQNGPDICPLPTSSQPVAEVTPVPEVQPEQAGNYVVVLKSDRMGQGDDDLGSILAKAYVNTLKELDNKPAAIIMYNGGVKLATVNSGADETLKLLEAEGVDVIVCGACVEFFELKGKLAAGRISNMYEIAERMAAAGHVVNP
ncbi:sulfurtransferase-like selenium metabolism protein YedF [Sansalvadorimonas sp. 2012CJ34-2]|uniref:Sulfurtransferase-like selenium metabolism protein YedF n=1 Tax=Parendozoicomonas callyspongiae TaxID=2942213 RepID=A0ABT0PIE1_9GAMM|nr:sulfurtransferase-like selenium metabolism protein YedF [Sansalvadorimonas sp. 2012CJ34-2]MCL6271152.1 sulfurtransferase-like selenium metabolism protein YedF [Sansalvadorimonas sp. 2012CJ34-2]